MSSNRTRAIAYALLGATVAVIFVCFAPGHLNIDSLSQIQEADRWAFTNRHATMLLILWAPLYAVGLGPGFVLGLQIATFALGGYLVLRCAFERIAAAALTSLICLWPPVFGMLGSLGRDTWFAALLVASYGLLVRAAQRDWPARRRWLVLAAVAIWLALASRQNAFAAMLPAAVVLAALLLQRIGEGSRWAGLRRPRLAALGLGAGAIVAMLGTQVVGAIAARTENVHPEQYLFVYDLAAFSARAGENLFPPGVASDRGMESIDANFSVDSSVGLEYFEPQFVPVPLAPEQRASLRDEWLDQVTGDPGEYLALRTELAGRQLALTRDARSVFISDVLPNDYGYRIWFGGPNAAALDYLGLFTEPKVEPVNPFYAPIAGGPLHAVWVYLLVAAVAAVALAHRRAAWPERTVGALALSALLAQPVLYFLAMGTEYRFEFPAVVATTFAAAVAIRVVVRTRTTARSPAAPDAPPARSPSPARP